MLMSTLSTPQQQTRPAKPARWLWIIGTWMERSRQRHALRELDARLLDDVGISDAERRQEIAKPFWR
ncbi:MAG: DUF1127 domain-containing protein [Rhodospirillaceae bacterium]|jgi:uncharacterized protein YjiS (DUF1127 family)|nr:DUF1127 domain-containing protein [Rhodospirillaceae bacterium]MBT3491779.1 DUF1127 domain-containing protein [Rhodospirillaceae bacterium]MBT3783165.1 DUF1127 domain-containing protein [Rhodospirillaceae bacterium]MBT3978161.1 DUF1127 domain-containing protein [Rhodospirillaceae bacterium]MBT4167142.1 DUF1127 domain-containing protein [Rhodospirillaceae bacterium]